MAHETHIVDKFTLDNDSSGTYDGVLAVADDEYVVGVIARGHKIVALVKFLEGGFTDCGEDAERGEETYVWHTVVSLQCLCGKGSRFLPP